MWLWFWNPWNKLWPVLTLTVNLLKLVDHSVIGWSNTSPSAENVVGPITRVLFLVEDFS